MSVWQDIPSASVLCGSEGELVSVSISADPRDLEALLEALAHTGFPINPQIYHGEGRPSDTRTVVVFPAYAGNLAQVQKAVANLRGAAITTKGMLEEIQSLVDRR